MGTILQFCGKGFKQPRRMIQRRSGKTCTPGLQSAPKHGPHRFQVLDLPLDLRELRFCAGEHCTTGDSPAVADAQNSREFVERKTESQRLSNQRDPEQRIRRVVPVAVSVAGRRLQKTEPFVVPNCIRANSRSTRELSRSHSFGSVHPGTDSKVKRGINCKAVARTVGFACHQWMRHSRPTNNEIRGYQQRVRLVEIDVRYC